MGNPDIVKIVRYFKENNRSIDITISTNGSIGNSADYAELAELGVTLRVALDGVGEFNELYRVNAKWDKIVQNLNSFALKSSKHQLENTLTLLQQFLNSWCEVRMFKRMNFIC
jgi:sulfatase maturation enzyme AslB (radical SAM superfamily)